MKRILLLSTICALAGTAAGGPAIAQELPWNAQAAQAPQPAPGPPITPAITPQYTQGTQVPVTPVGPPAPAAAQQVMYATKSVNIRAGAGRQYNAIGKVPAGQGVAVVGQMPGGWYQLASGGYVSASVLSPTPVVVAHHPRPMVVPAPSQAYYPVGVCEPYSRVVTIGGQPNQINGTACKQPDGTWRITNYGVPAPVPAPAPVYAAPAPLVYGPPPPPIIYEHRHDPYYRY